MKIAGWAKYLLLAAPLLGGCGNFWQKPATTTTTTSTCTTNCSTATSGDFFILNQTATGTSIVGEYIKAGSPASLTTSTTAQSGQPYAMAIAPNGNFLTVSSSYGVVSYPITSSGLDTGVAVSSTGLDVLALRIDKSSSWLVEASSGSNQVILTAFPISTTTGVATGSGPTATFSISNAAARQVVFSPDNSKVFVALGSGGTIVVPFNAKAGTGVNPFGNATTIGVANAGQALSVAVDPAANFFYIGETLAAADKASGGLRVFNYSTFKEITGSPFNSGGLAPNFILPVSSQNYVYVANGEGTTTVGNIKGFAVSSGTLTAGATVNAGEQPIGLALDSSGAFLLAVNEFGSPYLSPFTFDTTTTGTLDLQSTANTGASPLAVVAVP